MWEKTKAFFKEIYYFISSKIFLTDFAKMLGIIALALFMIFWLMTCFTRHGESLKVGNYVGKNMKQVEDLIDDDGFEYVVTDSIFRENFPPDMVLEQNPAPNSYVKTGRTIYLKITKAAGEVLLPDLAGRDDLVSYTDALKMIGIRVGKVDTIPDANLSDGTIVKILVKGRDVYLDIPKGVRIPQGIDGQVDLVVSRRETNETSVPNFIVNGSYMTAEEYRFIVEDDRKLKIGQIIKDASVTDEHTAFVTKVYPSKGTILMKGDSITIYLTQKDVTKSSQGADKFEQ
jgi:eukaryotic-like serine/threonine-protein kinase